MNRMLLLYIIRDAAFRSLQRCCFVGLITFLCILLSSNSFGQGKKHIVAYGGIHDRHLTGIAQNCDILIAGLINPSQAIKLKRLNPNIIILKYQNAIYVHNDDADWKIIDSNEIWFAHSTLTNERIKQKRFNAYLMNLSSEGMRSFRTRAIIEHTPDYFDGIFLDDCHENFPVYLSSNGLIPKETNLFNNWSKYIIDFLVSLRSAYLKRIIINGPIDRYLPYVDGCMMEDFIHSNEHPDGYFRTASQTIVNLDKVEQLKKHGKLILLQSGTLSKDSLNNETIFQYCFTSYLLVASEITSFNFKPGRGYYFQGIPSYMHINTSSIGSPVETYKIVRRYIAHENYLQNGSFDMGFKFWTRRRGSPRIIRIDSTGKMAVHLSSNSAGNSDMIDSDFIPVSPSSDYSISLLCKSIKNLRGSAGWKKLGLVGRFYNKDKILLSGAYDLQFDHGSYDWRPFDVSFRSPDDAKYFKLAIGFIGDGSGEGFVTDIFFTLSKNIEVIISRRYTNGMAVINPTRYPATINLMKNEGYLLPPMLDAITGKFLFYGDIKGQ